MELLHGDCLELMKGIPDGSVDLVLADPPYGTMDTDGGRKIGINGWDKCIPTNTMFDEISRVLRPNGKAVLFSQEPYTSKLITSTTPSVPFSYRAIWKKDSFGNCLGANKNMVSLFEDICIFSKIAPKHDFDGGNPLREYFQRVLEHIGHGDWRKGRVEVLSTIGGRADHTTRVNSTQFALCTEIVYIELTERFELKEISGFREYADLRVQEDEYRTALIERMNREAPSVFNLWQGHKSKANVLEYAKDNDGYHPTQKPVRLLEDLIQTFSNEGDTVLDFTMGSGSTGVACVNTNRDFIGIELDAGYFQIAKDRIEQAEARAIGVHRTAM